MATISQVLKLEDRVSPVFRNVKKNAESVIDTYEHLATTQDKVWKQMEKLEKYGHDSGKLYKSLSKEYFTLDTAMQDLAKTGKSTYADSLNKATELQERLTSSVKGSSAAMNALHSIARKVAAVFGIKSLINMSDTMTQTQARLGIALSSNNWTGSAEGFSNAIFAAAQRSRSDYNTLAGTVSKLGMQAGGAFAGPKELIKFAENLNKVFITSGLDSSSIQSVMYNLTQSMSTGHLLGNDYRILKMNAPELINMLKRTYANNDQATLDTMVSKGQITSQMLKSAIIDNTEDIEKKFKEMPVTWEQVWIRIKNTTQRLLKPVLKIVSNLAKAFDDGLTWVEEHWEQLLPVFITGITILIGALGVLLANKIANISATGISTAMAVVETKAFLASAAAAELKATAEGKAAIKSLEHATAMHKTASAAVGLIGKILLFIVAVVGAANVFSYAYEQITGETASAVGLITGSLAAILAFLHNVGVGLINSLLGLARAFVEPIEGIINYFVIAFNNGFNSIGDAWANLLGSLISTLIGFAKIATPLIDAVFGTTWTADLTNLQNSLKSLGKNEKAPSNIKSPIPNDLERTKIYGPNVNDSFYYKWYYQGAAWENSWKKSNPFKGTEDIQDMLDKLISPNDKGDPSLNTNVSGSVSLDKEDIQLLLDIATRDFNIEYQQLTPEITMTFTGDIGQPSDVDGVIENIYSQLREEYNGDLEVVTN